MYSRKTLGEQLDKLQKTGESHHCDCDIRLRVILVQVLKSATPALETRGTDIFSSQVSRAEDELGCQRQRTANGPSQSVCIFVRRQQHIPKLHKHKPVTSHNEPDYIIPSFRRAASPHPAPNSTRGQTALEHLQSLRSRPTLSNHFSRFDKASGHTYIHTPVEGRTSLHRDAHITASRRIRRRAPHHGKHGDRLPLQLHTAHQQHPQLTM